MKKNNLQKGDGEIGFIVVVLILIFLIWMAVSARNPDNEDISPTNNLSELLPRSQN